MRLLDLFCGAGGAAEGYRRAGFTEIIGIDIKPQPRYPFTFIQADAMSLPLHLGCSCGHSGLQHVSVNRSLGDNPILSRDCQYCACSDYDGFDLIHASPPCQKYSAATKHLANDSPQLIPQVRQMLTGHRYVIENTPGAPLINPITICGLALNLNVKRHRLFESNQFLWSTNCPPGHPGNWFVVFGHEIRDRRHGHAAGRKNKIAAGRAAMGIDWMTRGELSESIPPAYTEWIGKQIIPQL